MGRCFWGLLLAVWLLPAVAQAQPATHLVQPGDTWRALSYRYGVPVVGLQTAVNQPNPWREPAIGSQLALPPQATPHTGRLLVIADGDLLKTAVRLNRAPALLAQHNATVAGRLVPMQPLFVPDETAVPRQLPPDFVTLALSAVPAQAGQALGWRAQTAAGAPPTSTLGAEQMAVFQNGRALLALTGTGAFWGSGDFDLTIETAVGYRWSQPWRFVDGAWTFQQLTLTGDAAAIDQAAIDAERARLLAIWTQASPAPQWNAPFALPIASYLDISSDYGARRSYNGGPYRTYHEGVDFSAYGGTAVVAPAAGTVVVAEPLYVRGGAVILDHGLGIYTGYYHLSQVLVQPGERVTPGQQVGAVGTTGLSTGNHLHWDLLVNGVWVDAAAWLDADMAGWILAAWQQGDE